MNKRQLQIEKDKFYMIKRGPGHLKRYGAKLCRVCSIDKKRGHVKVLVLPMKRSLRSADEVAEHRITVEEYGD